MLPRKTEDRTGPVARPLGLLVPRAPLVLSHDSCVHVLIIHLVPIPGLAQPLCHEHSYLLDKFPLAPPVFCVKNRCEHTTCMFRFIFPHEDDRSPAASTFVCWRCLYSRPHRPTNHLDWYRPVGDRLISCSFPSTSTNTLGPSEALSFKARPRRGTQSSVFPLTEF